MTLEDQHTDRKSLRTVTGKTADWESLDRLRKRIGELTVNVQAYAGDRRWRRYRLSGVLSKGQKGGEFS